MKDSGDRTPDGVYDLRLTSHEWSSRTTAIGNLPRNAPHAPIVSYAYRSFDRQRLLADARLISRPRPPLWLAHSDSQLYFTSLFTNPVSTGPCVTVAHNIPDMHHFRGSFGAKDVFPLYRDAAATEANILPGFLDFWGSLINRDITPEAFAAYVYALLGHAGFVARFWDELEDCQLRVPITLDGTLFDAAVELGSRLVFLHTYGERFAPRRNAALPRGSARVKTAISDAPADYPNEFEYIAESQTLIIGDGKITNVPLAVWQFDVSGLQVVKSWLGYRMKDRKGKKSSPLDDIHPERWTSAFTDELLRLLSILEHTIAMEPDLNEHLEAVCAGPLLPASDLPAVPPHVRKPPRAGDRGLFDDGDTAEDAPEDSEDD